MSSAGLPTGWGANYSPECRQGTHGVSPQMSSPEHIKIFDDVLKQNRTGTGQETNWVLHCTQVTPHMRNITNHTTALLTETEPACIFDLPVCIGRPKINI